MNDLGGNNMSKAILVMNMPQTCGECPLCASYQESTWSSREYWCPTLNNADVEPFVKKPKDCPLKPLPEKEYADTGIVEVDEFAAGYNSCIDEILGDK